MGNPQSPEVQKLAATYEQELATFWQAYRKEDPGILPRVHLSGVKIF